MKKLTVKEVRLTIHAIAASRGRCMLDWARAIKDCADWERDTRAACPHAFRGGVCRHCGAVGKGKVNAK